MPHALTMTTEELNPLLLVGMLVLVVAVGAVRFSVRSGLPTLLIYLGLGLAIGSGGFGVQFEDATLTHTLGYLALVVILAEGGLTTSWKDIRPAVGPAAVLATVGVVISTLVVGLFLHFALGTDWKLAMLVGAILSSTDAAAVFSVLRNVPLPKRLSGLLEAESGLNDAPVVILVTMLAVDSMPGRTGTPWYEVLGLTAYELLAGAVIGIALGYVGAWFMSRAASASSGLFSIGILGVTVLAYASASMVHASGFLATYLSGLVIANRNIPHRAAVRSFAQAMGWFAQIGLFVMLGLLANPWELWEQVGLAVVIGLVLTFVARPLSVVVSLTPFRFPWKQQVFVSWAGLRGAVPVVLATVPFTMGTPGTEKLFDLVFVLVIVYTVVQAPTMPWLARRLRIENPDRIMAIDVETTPLDELGAEMLTLHVGPGSKLHGVRIREARLPAGANVTLVVRSGKTFVPDRDTVFRTGDDVLIIARAEDRQRVEDVLHAVSERGRLPFWHRPGASRTMRPRRQSVQGPWAPRLK